MAVHGSLVGAVSERPRTGYIASLREVAWRGNRLDAIEGDIVISATRLAGDDDRVAYAFAIRCEAQELLTGRATVLLRVGPE